MKLQRTLKRPAVLFILSLLLGGTVLTFTLNRHDDSRHALSAAQGQAAAAQHELRQTPQRLDRLTREKATYAALQAAGFLDPEDRLDWISTLARLRDEMQLQRLVWHLAPQRAVEHGLHASRMELDLSQVDAPRLDRFITRLKQTAHGRFTVVACTLEPAAATAHCILDWWTWHAQ